MSLFARIMAIEPHIKVLREFLRKKIRFVLIGVFGINHYADSPEEAYSTLDCDTLIEPSPAQLLKAMRILSKHGYALESGVEPLVQLDAWLAKRILEHGAVITARKNGALTMDLVTKAAGPVFSQWWKKRKIFKVEKNLIPVGGLAMLIDSKQKSNREKDRQFLTLYGSQITKLLGMSGRI